MQITCLGAAGQVTGSCFLLEDGGKYLIDCGLFQGGKSTEAMNRQDWPFDPGSISAIFLTHAHIDHSGRIPKLVKDGFRGRIFCTQPTAELCRILLLDSASIQEMEAEWLTRKNERRGEPGVLPLYTVADARACFPLFEPVGLGEIISIDPHLQFRFREAGHILGSSILEVWCDGADCAHKAVFSGDLGRRNQLIVRDPHHIFDADTLFVESTYGNREHKSFEDSKKELLEAILFSVGHREKVVIPAFAVERTQEILYVLGEFFRQRLIPSIPVYLDSPLAIAATDVFRRMREYYDEDAVAIVNQGHDPFDFPELILSKTVEDSIRINQTEGAAIVIAGNGMCTAGRIKHHLKHNLWRPGASLVIAGFQAEGSPGRKIVEGAKTVRIFGEEIAARARVFTIGGFSAHAGQADLLGWISHFANPDMRVYVVHGERSVSEEFARVVHERFGFRTFVPVIGDTISLTPVRGEVAPGAGEKPGWQFLLSETIRKAREIENLWAHNPQAVSTELLHEMGERLSGVQDVLDAVVLRSRGQSS